MKTMLRTCFNRRRAGLFTAIGAVLAITPVIAQPPQNGGTIPFLPKDFAGNPEAFFEQMFGKSTPEEEKLLADIDVPFKEEREFGRQQVEAFKEQLQEQGLRVVGKGKDVDYLKKLVDTVKPFMKNAKRYQKITVYVVDSPRVDARSFPGGTLFFYKGLLTFADNEAALVGIVGHELSHLDHGHQLLPLKKGKIIERTAAAGAEAFNPQKFFAAGTTMMRLMGRPFRPEDEAAADRDGAVWAYRAGYDPREMARLFDRLHKRDNDPKLPFGSFFRTHPYSDDRCEAIMKQYDELQQADPHDALYRGKKNLAQRIARSQQEFAE
ncbi:MAG TPA: M48 family metallopeptidase [Planctomycetaceae bacterium]